MLSSIILAVIRLSCQTKMFRLMQQMLLSLQQLIHLRKRKATTYTYYEGQGKTNCGVFSGVPQDCLQN